MSTVVQRAVERAAPKLAVVLCGLAVLLPGCKRDGGVARPPLRVVEVQAVDLTPPEQLGAGVTTAAELEAACVAGLRKSGAVVVGLAGKEARPGDFRLHLEVRLEGVAPSADTEGKGIMRAAVRGRLAAAHRLSGSSEPRVGADRGEAEPAWPELARLDQEAMAEKVSNAGEARPTRAAWAAHTRRAVQDTAEALGAQLMLMQAPREVLLKTLSRKDVDPDLRGVAIQLAGLRKEKGAVPLLIGLLKEPEAEVRDRAIGALIEIGDRGAVKPLAASAAFQDTYELGKILEAVASLGGEEARSYLAFVAAGHQSEIIRAEAKVALSHLEQREQRGGKTEPRQIAGDPEP